MSDDEDLGKELQDKAYEVGYKSPPREGQWKPGQSGNPGGRPKWKPISDELRRFAEQEGIVKGVALAMYAKAEKGDVSAANFIADRIEGKVAQSIGGSTELGPVRLVMKWEKDED